MEAPTRDLWLYHITSGATTQVTLDSARLLLLGLVVL